MRKVVKGTALVLGVALLAAAGMYAWARLNVDNSGIARAIVWMDADVMDYKRFPENRVEAGTPLEISRSSANVAEELLSAAPGNDLNEFLTESQTAAFLVFGGGRLVYEEYFNGYKADSTVTSFSVAKSFIGTLVGLAIEDGSISDIDDPVTEYVPELLDRDERFSRITIRHLLTMSSGLRWDEKGLPWSDDAETYYGTDLRSLAIEDTEIVSPPGEEFVYNPYNTLLLGLVLERAVDESVTQQTQERLWQPVGAEADASWSLDSTEHEFEKMESGFNATAVDMARLGLLYLNDGRVGNEQVVPENWIREAIAFDDETDPSTEYGYQWWTYRDEEVGDWALARGNKGQFIAVFPEIDLVIARFGMDFGYDHWPQLLGDMAKALAD